MWSWNFALPPGFLSNMVFASLPLQWRPQLLRKAESGKLASTSKTSYFNWLLMLSLLSLYFLVNNNFFSEVLSPRRSHYTNYWYSWVQTIHCLGSYLASFFRSCWWLFNKRYCSNQCFNSTLVVAYFTSNAQLNPSTSLGTHTILWRHDWPIWSFIYSPLLTQ